MELLNELVKKLAEHGDIGLVSVVAGLIILALLRHIKGMYKESDEKTKVATDKFIENLHVANKSQTDTMVRMNAVDSDIIQLKNSSVKAGETIAFLTNEITQLRGSMDRLSDRVEENTERLEKRLEDIIRNQEKILERLPLLTTRRQ